MSTPTVSTLEIAAIDHVFEMGSGYVLDFTNRTFSMFFADLGIDVDHEFPGGSKANRLRDLLRASDPERVARVLESLLEHRGKRDGDESSPHLTKVRTLIARLRKTSVAMAPVIAAVEVLSLAYVHELETKTDQRMSSGDFEGAITVARTMLEEVLLELQRRLVEQPEDYKGDLPKLLKAVTKSLGIDEQRTDIDERFRQVARGLVGIVHGLAPGDAWHVVGRIAIEELEAWYFGDWQAVRAAYPKVPAGIPREERYRDPDAIRGGTWEALERILQDAGYFKEGLRKIEAARAIAEHMEPKRNASGSFGQLRSLLGELDRAS